MICKGVPTINEHLKEIYSSKELTPDSTIRNFRIVQNEGNRQVARSLNFYNLDAIISVGYRVNSLQATRFCQWATKILKEYMSKSNNLFNLIILKLLKFSLFQVSWQEFIII